MIPFDEITSALCFVLEIDEDELLKKRRSGIPFRKTLLVAVLFECGYGYRGVMEVLSMSSIGAIGNMRAVHCGLMKPENNNQLYVYCFNRTIKIIYDSQRVGQDTV